MSEASELRIGELARRTGVATDLLRAWERRYGLLAPTRTDSGYRLYSSADVRRVGRMRELLAAGVSAAEAAREALSEPVTADLAPEGAAIELREAIKRLDDAASHMAFDRLLADFSLDAVLVGAVLPLLRELGEGWERGEVSIAQEHFASHLIRGRLLGLARGWDRGSGPRAVLACPPEERHDLGLLIFGLALREHGWRITFLGGDTPVETLADTVERLVPEAVVLSATDPARFDPIAASLRALAGKTTTWIAGPGADAAAAERSGSRLLDVPPIAAAALVAA
jgi:MerR family transcriptional regulator, light-induced transcriptional regulator